MSDPHSIENNNPNVENILLTYPQDNVMPKVVKEHQHRLSVIEPNFDYYLLTYPQDSKMEILVQKLDSYSKFGIPQLTNKHDEDLEECERNSTTSFLANFL